MKKKIGTTEQKRVKTVWQFEEYLFSHFKAFISGIDEIDNYERFFAGDKEHDYSDLAGVYRVVGELEWNIDYDRAIFILLFAKNGKIYASTAVGGMLPKKLARLFFS